MYYSLDDEVFTHDAIDKLIACGKTVVLPSVVGDGLMELRRYAGPESLKAGAFGIMEPVGERFGNYAAIDVAAVPGMAFDRHGNRLGRGKGYYDRLLPQFSNALLVGICFPFQVFDNIPAEPHDVRMDLILSGEGQ